MPIKLIASAVIAALLLTGTAIPVSQIPGQGEQLQQPAVTRSTETEPVHLTGEEALDAALNHAGLTRDRIRRLERELDRERRGLEWEIEFVCDGFEYSYSIDAETGSILDWEKDWDD